MLLLAATLAAASAAPLRVGTYDYPAYDRRLALASLARLIEETTGRPTQVVLLPTPDGLAAALRARRIDVAMTNLASFMSASRDRSVKPIASLAVPAATLDGYRGVLLARRDAGVRTLGDIKVAADRLRYAEVLPGSTSGAMVQAAAIRGAGGDRRNFRLIEQAGTHDAALERLLAGEADVASLAEGPWRTLKETDPTRASSIIEVWRSEPLPPGPIVCVDAASVPCDHIARRLLRNDYGSRHAAAELAKGWSETAGATKFHRVSVATYRVFVD